jgi:hypothetical protein
VSVVSTHIHTSYDLGYFLTLAGERGFRCHCVRDDTGTRVK